jgi:hypothetical protein
MGIKAAVQMPKTDREFQKWCAETFDLGILSGEGSPEGVVPAEPGTLYRNRLGGAGTTLYAKETGTGNTGWVAH